MNSKLLSLFLVVLIAAGCGEGAPEAAGGEGRAWKIAAIPKGTTHEFWKSVHSGVNKAVEDTGADVTWMGPSKEDDREEQIKVVENFIVRRVDGIIISPTDNTALIPVLKEAEAAGIPVVVVDSGVDWDGYKSFVATDNRQGGVEAARHLAGLVGPQGKVLMMRYYEGSASTSKREIGFLDTLAGEFPEIEVLSGNQYGGATSETCFKTAENLLINYPEVEGIFCACEPTTFGMLRALQDAGSAGKIQFVGFDATEKLLQAVRDSEIHGLILQDPFRMGELSVKRMIDHLEGRPVDHFIDTGVTVATPENLESDAVKALWNIDFDRWLK